MKSNYKRLGNYIHLVDKRNRNLEIKNLIGLSTRKKFIPSISNTIGTDMSTYRILNTNQFTYCSVTSRNNEKITIALYQGNKIAMVSQAYDVFEIIDDKELLPEYLMMWFRRAEFDRYARFMSHGSVREMFGWEEMCEVRLPIPHPEKQKEIVKEYNTLVNHIELNSQLIQKLEETAQAIYKQWFVDFEFPNAKGKPYKSSGGEMEFNKELEMEIPKEWRRGKFIDVADKIFSGGTPNTEVNEYWNGNYLWFSSGETRNSIAIDSERTITRLGIKHSSTRLAKIGDTLLASAGQGKTRGQSSFCKVDTYINQSIICVRPKKQFFSAWIFFGIYSRYAEIRNDSDVHSIRGSITTKDISNLSVNIPDESVIDAFENIGLAIINNIYNSRLIIKKLENLKSILHTRMSKI